eukprot:360742-Chlamydomonas_euryale.AAC.1
MGSKRREGSERRPRPARDAGCDSPLASSGARTAHEGGAYEAWASVRGRPDSQADNTRFLMHGSPGGARSAAPSSDSALCSDAPRAGTAEARACPCSCSRAAAHLAVSG